MCIRDRFSTLLAESGSLDDASVSKSVLSQVIPASLQDLLMARLDRMASDPGVIQLAAAIGREFSWSLLAAASESAPDELQSELEKLVAAEVLFRKGTFPEASFIFKHALIQDSAYNSLLKKRRHGIHARIGRAIEEHFPEIVSQQPELVAHPSGLRGLFSSTRVSESAIEYSRDSAAAVIRGLRSLTRLSFIDLGSSLNPLSYFLQRECDHIVLVIDPVYVTLMVAREIIQEIASTVADQQRVSIVVVNRAASSTTPSWREVEQVLGMEIRAVISLASELFNQALQANVPAVTFQPTAIASSQLIKLSEDISARMRTTGALSS